MKAPTLITVGDKDIFTPIRMSETLHKGIAGSELAVFADCAHVHHWEDLERLIPGLSPSCKSTRRGKCMSGDIQVRLTNLRLADERRFRNAVDAFARHGFDGSTPWGMIS